MLRIIPCVSAKSTVAYYSAADYYTDGGETTGRWHGRGADMLGLSGQIALRDWKKLCYNRKPDGTPLTARTRANRRVAYDFNFSACKSVSLLYGVTGDERILKTFRDAVITTMSDIENEVATRVRKNGEDGVRTTGNLVWGEFIHTTARPVAGHPDPSLHAHCVALNATFCPTEREWKAGEFGGLKRDGKYFEALFQSRLARGIEELGLTTIRTRTGWEIEGFSPRTLEAFSRRTALIEKTARLKGITNPVEKNRLGAITREAKMDHISPGQLQIIWRHRLEAEGDLGTTEAIARQIGGTPIAPRDGAAGASASLAASNAFERDSVVRERRLIADALRRGYGAARPEDVLGALRLCELIPAEREGEKLVTTREVLAEERRLIQLAAAGRGVRAPLCREITFPDGLRLSGEQRAAIAHIVTAPDDVILVRGKAGTGKTTMASEAVRQIEAGGTKVCMLAPTGDASRNTLRKEGFTDADTLARLLVDRSMQEKARGSVLWVDEAGLIGVPTMLKLFDLARQLGSRVVLVGDSGQNGPVERGASLRLLETEAGLETVELKQVHRQTGEYRAAVEQVARGNVRTGLGMLDRMGWVHERADGERDEALATAYIGCVTEGWSGLVVAATHAEKDRVSAAIRTKLRESGLITGTDREVERLTPLQLTAAQRADPLTLEPGLVAVYTQNARGRTRGERVAIVTGDEPLPCPERFELFRRETLPLARGDRIRITRGCRTLGGRRIENGSTFIVNGIGPDGAISLATGDVLGAETRFIDHGYVQTMYSSQGRTVDRVFVSASSDSETAVSQENTYVALSRGRLSVDIFTDCRQKLLEGASRSGVKPSATETLRHGRVRSLDCPRAPDQVQREFTMELHRV